MTVVFIALLVVVLIGVVAASRSTGRDPEPVDQPEVTEPSPQPAEHHTFPGRGPDSTPGAP